MCYGTPCPLTRACLLSHFSHVQLCDPIDCRPPGSSVHGILQARILEWVAMPFLLSDTRTRTHTHNFNKCQPPEVFFSRKGRHKLTLARLFTYHTWSFRHPSSCYGIYFPFSWDKILYRLWIPFFFHPCLSNVSQNWVVRMLIWDLLTLISMSNVALSF